MEDKSSGAIVLPRAVFDVMMGVVAVVQKKTMMVGVTCELSVLA